MNESFFTAQKAQEEKCKVQSFPVLFGLQNSIPQSFLKTLLAFHYTGWFIGILIMAYNPHVTGYIVPPDVSLYTAGSSDHCSFEPRK